MLGCSSDDKSDGECLKESPCRQSTAGQAVTDECKDASKHGGGIDHKWIRSFYISLPDGQSFGKIEAQYTVPAAPAIPCNQAIYYFVGFQDKTDTTSHSVVQPVLGWWKEQGGWFIQSEDCCQLANVNSRRIKVKPGDTIEASVVYNDNGTVTIKTSSGGQTTTLNAKADPRTLNQAVATLEVYNLDECGEEPVVDDFVFTVTKLEDSQGNAVNTPWTQAPHADECNAKISVTTN